MAIFLSSNNNKPNSDGIKKVEEVSQHHDSNNKSTESKNMNEALNSIPFSIPVGMGNCRHDSSDVWNNPFMYIILLALLGPQGFGGFGRNGFGGVGMTPAGAEIAGSLGANIDAARAKIAEVAGMVESGKCDLKGIESALGNLGLRAENTKDLLINVLGRLSDEVSRGNADLASKICECCCTTKSMIQDSTYKIGDRICGVEKEILRGTSDVNQNLAGLGFAVERNAGQLQNSMTQGMASLGYNQERIGNAVTNAVNTGFCQTNQLLSKGFSDIGYLSEKNTSAILAEIVNQGNLSRSQALELHNIDIVAQKDAEIAKLVAKNEEAQRNAQTAYIISQLKTTSSSST